MATKQTTLPYEVRFIPLQGDLFLPRGFSVVLGRYESDHLASRCAGLIRACVTDGTVEVVFNDKATEAS
jgi:hypothetical protein